MTTLVHVETDGGRPDPDALGVLSAVRRAGAEPAAVVFGHQIHDAVAEVAAIAPHRIFVVDDPSLAEPAAAPRVAALMSIIEQHPRGYWLATTSTLTTEIAARLGMRAHAGIAWGLTAARARDGNLTVSRLSGNDTVVADLTWNSAWGIGLFRSHAFDPEPMSPDQAAPEIVTLPVPPFESGGVTIIETPPDDSSPGPRLDAADVIVSAGRGIGDPAQLDAIRELADLLGGVAGVSLPLVELGWAPRAMQVGQTGTIVAPLLYVACGISGQIQHRVGMERSGTIIAINTDPSAPIMSFCDLAIVADVKVVVPRLIELLKTTRESTITG